MIRIDQITTEQELDDFKRCMLKCKDCDCVGTLKRFVPRSDGSFSSMQMKREMFSGHYLMNVDSRGTNGGYVYLDITLSRKADIKRIVNLWDTVRRRGTQCFSEGRANDYKLIIDLVAGDLANNKLYTLSFMQPIFVSDEGAGNRPNTYMYKMVFEIKDVRFSIEDVTPDEIEYEMLSDRSEDYEASELIEETPDDEIADVNKDYIKNDKIINNDSDKD